MKTGKRSISRLLAVMLVFMLVCGLMPITAFAEDEASPDFVSGAGSDISESSSAIAAGTAVAEEKTLQFISAAEFFVPEGSCGTAVDAIDITGGVSGGTVPYEFRFEAGAPEWLAIENGIITGTRPDTEQAAATATVIVTDHSSPVQSCSVTISVGAVTAVAEPEAEAPQEDVGAEAAAEDAAEAAIEAEAGNEAEDGNASAEMESGTEEVSPLLADGAPSLAASDDTAETVTVSGTVLWVNRDKQSFGQRPASSTVRLLANSVDTGKFLTVTATNSSTGTTFAFEDLPKTDDKGNAISYTVYQDTITNYETGYSVDTLKITNSYIGGVPSNHTFRHIDVRIAGAYLEIIYLVKDAKGNVISRASENITASVTKVESVSVTTTAGTTTCTGFTKSGTYEFRKMNGIAISGKNLDSTARVTMIVDLVDTNGKTYDNVSVQCGLGAIMEAAYNCDGYRNGSFDGLDFNVGTAQNYTVEITSYGLGVTVNKNITDGYSGAEQFSGGGGEFTFNLVEYNGSAATGRSWAVSNDAGGTASFVVIYPYSSMTELEAYANRTYTYRLTESTGTSTDYIYDDTAYTFTVKFTLESDGDNKTLKPAIQETSYADGIFSFTNVKNSYGSLVVKKTVAGNALIENKEFSFTITLSNTAVNGTFSGVTFTNGVAGITLKGGESVTIAGLPAGTGYTVTEKDYSADGYTTAWTGDTGTIVKDTAAVAECTNTRDTFGSLIVRKVLAGNSPSTKKAFRFTVTLGDTTISGSYGDMNFTNGVASFTLKGGEEICADNLPNGVSYTVTEDDYSSDGYATDKSGDTGTITGSEAVTAIFTNTRNVTPDTGICLDCLPYLLLLGAAVGGTGLLVTDKRRRARR